DPQVPFRSTAKQHGGVTGRGFLPGRSGNPRGRPKQSGDVRDLARGHTLAAVATLAEIMRNGRTDSARGAAAQAIDGGWGKPVKAVNLGPADPDTRPGGGPVIVIESAVPRRYVQRSGPLRYLSGPRRRRRLPRLRRRVLAPATKSGT